MSNALEEKDAGRSSPVKISHYLREGHRMTLVLGSKHCQSAVGDPDVEEADQSYMDRVRNMVDDYQRELLSLRDLDEESVPEVQIPFLSTISLN